MRWKMKKRWIVIALSMIVCSMFLLSGCKEKIYTSGDFIYRLNGGQLFLEGLSEQGKEKETIVIPKEIDGYTVDHYTYLYGLGYRGNFESENLKQIYIIPNVSMYILNFDEAPNLEKVVILGTNSASINLTSSCFKAINNHNVKMFVSTIVNYSETGIHVDTTGSIFKYASRGYLKLSNCNYFYNYDGAENDGYYWSDNYDYGEKITYVPQNPKREGYIFGGWYQEPECVNVWNFDTDTLPEAKYNEEGEALYQETRLYAKWYLQ